ncbi:hypothetical protein J3B02_004076, partial [Coemansia erecta]
MAAEKCTLIPEQLFESQDEFIMHVKRFAVENGFNVRLDDVERDKEGHIRKRDIVCSSEGAPRSKDATKREGSADHAETDGSEKATPSRAAVAHSGVHRRKSMKTGCRWLARASRQSSGMWKIIMLRLEHNHELATRYELNLPSAHALRTGDNDSISAAALAARSAVEGGVYRGPSVEFKNLFLQMTVACADLCWAAARHPETISEVLSEIRRLNQHLDKQSAVADASADASDARSVRPQSMLPAISEVDDSREDEAANGTGDKNAASDGSLVMMGHSNGMVVGNHVSGNSPPQPSHFLGVSHLITQHMDVTMDESPAQILARSQNHVDAHSPEIGTTNQANLSAAAMAAAVAAAKNSADTPVSPTQPNAAGTGATSSATGAVKRSRGRPRKNPMAADAKATKTKAQQKREQQQQQQNAQLKPTPTPADLASLSHKIISQNAASSPANMQRPLSSALALPPQPIQQHAHSRAQLLAGNANASSIIEPRTHASQAQRQAHPPQPQPQQETAIQSAQQIQNHQQQQQQQQQQIWGIQHQQQERTPVQMSQRLWEAPHTTLLKSPPPQTTQQQQQQQLPPPQPQAFLNIQQQQHQNQQQQQQMHLQLQAPYDTAYHHQQQSQQQFHQQQQYHAQQQQQYQQYPNPDASNVDAAVAAAAASGYGFAGRSRSSVGERDHNGQSTVPVVSSVYQPQQTTYQYHQQAQKQLRHDPSVSYRPQEPVSSASSVNAAAAAAAVATVSDSPAVGNIGHLVLSNNSSTYQNQLARMQQATASATGDSHIQR